MFTKAGPNNLSVSLAEESRQCVKLKSRLVVPVGVRSSCENWE